MILTLSNYQPIPRFDGHVWEKARIEGTTSLDADWSIVGTASFEVDLDRDPENPKSRSVTVQDVPSDTNYLRIVFIDDEQMEQITDPIPVAPTMGFATARDVSLRLGRDLSEFEIAQVELLIKLAMMSIYSSLSVPQQFQPPSDSLGFLQLITIELVARSMANPSGMSQHSEQLGSYSYTDIYHRNVMAPGMLLTNQEELAVRALVFGTTTESAQVPSLADVYANTFWPTVSLWYGNLPDATDDDTSDLFVWR